MLSYFLKPLLMWVALLVLLIDVGAMLVAVVMDTVLSRVWAPPISFLCKLTGKSNFFFARLLSAIGMGVLGGFYLLATALDLAEAELGFAPFDLLMAPGF